MSNTNEYRLDLSSDPSTNENLFHSMDDPDQSDETQRSNRRIQLPANANSDLVHQLIDYFKENFTSKIPFIFIVLFKSLYDHSTGNHFFLH
jgi:hypothetical protein